MPDDNTYPRPYCYSNCNSYPASTDTYANCDTHTNSDCYSNGNTDCHGDTYSYGNADIDPYSCTDAGYSL